LHFTIHLLNIKTVFQKLFLFQLYTTITLHLTMLKLFRILWNSFKMAVQELKNNKLRSALSLLGIAFGIFCIISILATVNSLEGKIHSDLQSFGNNTIYLDKWQYGGGPDYPWWKYIKRPEPKYEEMVFIKQKSSLAGNVCLFAENTANASYGDNILSNATIYCTTEDFNKIQDIEVDNGRYFSEMDFERGTAVAVIGYEYANMLLGNAEKAVGKTIHLNGKALYIIGVIKKQGKSILEGFEYDKCILVSYKFFASTYNVRYCNPKIMVQGKPNIASKDLAEDLRGVMRQLHRLSPKAEDDFAVNDINKLGEEISKVFGSINLAGWFIAGLSLLVGGFGVANIMFVTVRERTSQIGLKKAIGAKRSTILTEFLLESAFLCIIGGALGLLFVWLITLAISSVVPFPVFIAPSILILAVSICVIIGLLAGIIPASIAARMDPVVAIRSK
jgi:putative ABC transport system permease protein